MQQQNTSYTFKPMKLLVDATNIYCAHVVPFKIDTTANNIISNVLACMISMGELFVLYFPD